MPELSEGLMGSWFHLCHWHRVTTILIRKSPDCVGEAVGVFRCCKCRRIHEGIPPLLFGGVGEPETLNAYRYVSEPHKTDGAAL
jgi:hypothetical protein